MCMVSFGDSKHEPVNKYPNSILSHITAKKLKPTENGDVFFTSTLSSRNDTSIPGLIIHIINGNKALDSDMKLPYIHYICSVIERKIKP